MRALIKSYLKEYSLVESNIRSFDDFIEKRMQQIVEETNKNVPPDIGLSLGKIRIEKPQIIEADGSKREILPEEARLRNITYSSPLSVEIITKGGENSFVEIGKIPIMVKSKFCNLCGIENEEMVKNYEDPIDPGGYFLINGNERILAMIEDLAQNTPFVEEISGKMVLRMFSQKGAYRIPISMSQNSEGIIEVSFSRFKNIPVFPMIKVLGVTKDEEIASLINHDSDVLVVNFFEFANVQNAQDALDVITERSESEGTKKEILERTKARIDTYLFPHIGITSESRNEKALLLCKLLKHYLIAKEKNMLTDKDHYANKRVRLSGDLLADLFRVNFAIFLRDIIHNLQKVTRRKKAYSIKTLAKSTLFSQRIESAIATGSWIGERKGITRNMDKTNYFAVYSELQKVISLLPGEQENFKARTLHPTHYGRYCPVETPEGQPIGLRKNLAILARVSTPLHIEEENFFSLLKECGIEKKLVGGEKRDEKKSGQEEKRDEKKGKKIDVFFNCKFIGTVEDESFAERLREKRRNGALPYEMSISYDEEKEMISINTDAGRILRPLIIAKNYYMLKEKESLVEEGKIKFDDLLKEGIVEFIDAAEEENALVAREEPDAEHTHVEIDATAFLGLVTSLVPYGNCDQSSRLNRGSKTQKQSLGLYSAAYHVRLDNDVSILHYPQKPLVRSFIYDTLNIYPSGQNVVVAIIPHYGYNMEDAIVLNKASVERGLGRSTYFRPYATTELHYTGGMKDEICVPEKDVSGYRTEKSYSFLEEDGIVEVESNMQEGDVIIGKTSPPKFLAEAGEISLTKIRKENSVIIRQEEQGIIDSAFISVDAEGSKIVQVKTRDNRNPELGDKFSTGHGQKGVIGAIVPEENIPFTASGIKPDVIFNPHGIPGRMTLGYLIEILAGKVASLSGSIVDGTPFSSTSIDNLEKNLKELGFRYDGKEAMYDGITGKKLEAKIYIGNMYYLKLKYMAANKIHARASGKVTLLTRQPVEGRSKGGALRLGEMEQQALVAHGSSLLLKERYDSDKVLLLVCEKCGAMGVEDKVRKKEYCVLCGDTRVRPVEISYAFKLFMEELLSMHIFPKLQLKNKYE